MSVSTTSVRAPYLESLLAGQTRLPAGPLAWVNELRGAALESAHTLTLPTRNDEDWRFTDLSALYKLAFRPITTPISLPTAATLAPFAVPEAACQLVFVDGVFAPELSRHAENGGLIATHLAGALHTHTELVRSHLATIADYRADAFGSINAAYLQDGAVIVVRRDTAIAAPVHLLFVSTQAEAAVHPRVLVVAEPGAELTVIEDYVSLHEGVYCVNGVTEISAGANARVRHIKLQRESQAAFHIATCGVRIERDGHFASNSIAIGARISRFNLNVRQAAPGAHMEADGLALIEGHQLADTHSFFDHAAAHGASRQKHKTVLAGSAHAVFNGRVLVRPGAQLTDSAQESRNLLLSGRARVDTKPQLEIFADDVKCSHGATVGQLEAEELFYLQSRGLAALTARNLLTYGFAAEIVDRIPVPSIVRRLREVVLARTESKD